MREDTSSPHGDRGDLHKQCINAICRGCSQPIRRAAGCDLCRRPTCWSCLCPSCGFCDMWCCACSEYDIEGITQRLRISECPVVVLSAHQCLQLVQVAIAAYAQASNRRNKWQRCQDVSDLAFAQAACLSACKSPQCSLQDKQICEKVLINVKKYLHKL